MIKHIVFFKINHKNKETELKLLQKMIRDLKEKIPFISHIEAGINISPRESAFDIALVAEFKNEDDLKKYNIHPDHLELIKHLKSLNRELAVVDYVF